MQSKRRFIAITTRFIYTVWTLLLGIILAIIIEKNYSYAEYIATQEAITSTNKDLAYRSWVASHGGVYVKVDERTPPNPYLKHIKDRDFRAVGEKFTLMNPAYTLTQMMHDYTKLYGVKTHITSKKLLNPKNRPDMWETLALNKIEQNRENYIELNDIGDAEYLRLMKPLVTKKACLKCHQQQGYKVGDIRGGVSVAIPMKPLYEDAFKSSVLVSLLFLIIWILGVIAIYIFSKKLYKYIDEKELLYEEYIYGLVAMIEKRDTYTAGHSERVAHYSVIIAQEMGYSQQECDMLHRAGMLHDIGKIGIPDAVFLKPTKLSQNEYKLIQKHVVMSYEMLDGISLFDEIKEIVRDHHEHYDGSGYPRGLIGDDTPMLAQILMLSDSFDAMTTDRIYKGRKSVNEALQEIAKLSSKQFHPKIVTVALKVLKNVIIESHHHQTPKNLIEKERFSYFYKDPLTHLYNDAYLRANLNSIEQSSLAWITLQNFHQFNKKEGWQKGDELLHTIADRLRYSSAKSTDIYRFYGDNFFVFYDEESELLHIKSTLEEILKESLVSYKIKTAIVSTLIGEDESLEDVLKKIL